MIVSYKNLNEQWNVQHTDAVMSDVGPVTVIVKPIDYTIVGANSMKPYLRWRWTDKIK